MNERKHNNASDIARAFATYSLVPYLGILFCPGAFFMGTVAVAKSYNGAHANGRRASYFYMAAGFIVLGLQLLLWWLLYKVPEWAK